MGYTGTGLGVDYGSNVAWCGTYGGSILDTKQKLKALGFFTGTVNSTSDLALQNAAKAFAADMGITISGGITKAFCQALNARYESQMAGVQTPANVGAPEQQTTAGGARTCSASSPCPSPLTCQNGLCVAGAGAGAGAGGGGGAMTTGEEGTTGTGAGGWSSWTTGKKVAIVGGGLAVLGLVALLIFGGKKHAAPATAPMTANRRRRRRLRRNDGEPVAAPAAAPAPVTANRRRRRMRRNAESRTGHRPGRILPGAIVTFRTPRSKKQLRGTVWQSEWNNYLVEEHRTHELYTVFPSEVVRVVAE